MTIQKHTITQLQQRINKLRLYIILFFVCVLIPLAVIIYYGYNQFDNEMYFQYRWKSSNALVQINKTLSSRLHNEQQRSPAQYSFYQYVENPVTNVKSKDLSPLADPETYAQDIGLIGYFQIEPTGILASPLLPHQTRNDIADANTNLDWDEVERRLLIREQLKQILQENGLISSIIIQTTNNVQNSDWQPKLSDKAKIVKDNDIYNTQKIEPFQILKTQNSEYIFYRNVWTEQHRFIQGFIVKEEEYLHQLIINFFNLGRYNNQVQLTLKDSTTKPISSNYFSYNISQAGQSTITQHAQSISVLEQRAFFRGDLINPFQNLNLYFSTDQLPLGPASSFVFMFLIILIVVIIAGCIGFYWSGLKQIELAEQRMNFVSSVSHELKTPLTSILMYSDMLKNKMIQDESSKDDYHNFIYYESERLSRLINNILQLSKISRQKNSLEPEYISVDILKDLIQSKVSSLLEKNNFKLEFSGRTNITNSTEVCVDLDAFAQIIINLVDNAIKFFNAAKINDEQRRVLKISFFNTTKSKNKFSIQIRDYGPGISTSQLDKIFELFYRCGSELTRTTPGTGIGLALVNELVLAQDGQIDVIQQDIGVAFEMQFKSRSV